MSDQYIKVNDFNFCLYCEDEHFNILNDWLSRDYATFWGMQSLTSDERRAELAPTVDKFVPYGLSRWESCALYRIV
ncbi:hypothetical protein ACT691_18995 [Vibrio metschnikovii]